MVWQWTALGASGILFLLTALPLSKASIWWVRGLDFPRLQLAAFALMLTGCQAVLGVVQGFHAPMQAGLVLCLLSLLYHAWWILPYTPLWPREVRRAARTGPCLKLLTANVLTPNRQSEAFLALVRRYAPDLLITLESDAWWQSQLTALQRDYPYSVNIPLKNLYGMHLYSRKPLVDTWVANLVEPGVPSIHTGVKVTDSLTVTLHVLHPAPPSPTENEASTERDVELLVVAQSLSRPEDPVIVTGDLNDVAWSRTTRLFRKISGLLDPRVGRGMYNTFHAEHELLRWPLDHLFHSDHFTVSSLRRLPAFGSDHFPLFVELCYEPRRRDAQDGLQADNEDRALARETAAAEPVSAADVPTPAAPQR